MSVKAEHYDIIRKPLVTEKSTMASENGAVVFEDLWLRKHDFHNANGFVYPIFLFFADAY